MDSLFIQNTILSLVLGFLIGLQREMHAMYTQKTKDFGGARTFAMIALFGYLASWTTSFSPYFFPIASAILGLLLVATYIVNSLSTPDKGTTTEFAALVTFIIGAMLNFTPPIFPVFITMIVLFLLNIKEKIQEYKQTIAKEALPYCLWS